MEQFFDPKRREQSRAYSKVKYRSFILSTIIALVYNTCFVLLGWAANLAEWLAHSVASQSLQIQGFIWVYVGGWFLLGAVVKYFLSYRYQLNFGLSVQTTLGWLQDQVKGLVITLVVATLGLYFVFWLIMQFPATWWIQAWAGYALFMLFVMFVAPVLFMPLFNKFTPLQEGRLRQRLLEMARSVGAKIQGVYVMDMSRRTTGINAMFTGLGSTRRIILGDTMLTHCSEAEIEVVLAHELAHYHFGHIYKFYILSVVVAGAALSLTWQLLGLMPGFTGLPVIPLLALVFQILLLIIKPFQNTISRGFEVECDQFALERTNDPQAFISVMVKLADMNLADIDPPAWLEYVMYSHPSIANRIRHAQHYRDGH